MRYSYSNYHLKPHSSRHVWSITIWLSVLRSQQNKQITDSKRITEVQPTNNNYTNHLPVTRTHAHLQLLISKSS